MKSERKVLDVGRRRVLAAGAILPALAWTGGAWGQVKRAPVVIGWLNMGSRESTGHYLAAFKGGMTALEDREGAWADHPAEPAVSRGQGDRMTTRRGFLLTLALKVGTP